MKVGTTIVNILNRVSPIAAIGAMVVVIGGYFKFQDMGKLITAHCAQEKTVVQKADLDAFAATVKEQWAKQEQSIKEVEARREVLAKEIEKDRKEYADKQERRDTGQDSVYQMFGENLSEVNGRVQAMQGKLDTIAGDVTIIKQIHMQKPGP